MRHVNVRSSADTLKQARHEQRVALKVHCTARDISVPVTRVSRPPGGQWHCNILRRPSGIDWCAIGVSRPSPMKKHGSTRPAVRRFSANGVVLRKADEQVFCMTTLKF
jgi:hypothetical protein